MLVFAYGSLVNSRSRARTLGQFPATPAVGLGVRRAWCAHSTKRAMTALGVVLEPGAECNGVMIDLDPGLLANLDRRESSYERTRIEARYDDGTIRECLTYVAPTPRGADADHPIVQSYLDVVVSGFLDVGEHFVAHFVTSTNGWDAPRFNDRSAPRYIVGETLHAPDELDRVLSAALAVKRIG